MAKFRIIQSPKGKPESTDQTKPSKVFSKRKHEKSKDEKEKKKKKNQNSNPVQSTAHLLLIHNARPLFIHKEQQSKRNSVAQASAC
jgi:hypothetical protein